MSAPVYKRVLLKLSGEALVGTKEYGIDDCFISDLANQLVEIHKKNVELIIVIGGGNFFRGANPQGFQFVPLLTQLHLHHPLTRLISEN